MKKIQIGIVGYGNLGRGIEKGLRHVDDMELVGVFTRRNPSDLNSNSPVYSIDEIKNFIGKIDVLILCGGSASDIPKQAPALLTNFNTVDSFDNHSKIDEYFKEMDVIAREHKKVCAISTGWDPGLFSMNRVVAEAVLPNGVTNTFWGPGVSQGHGDAVRRIEGVSRAVQYTIPLDEAVESVKSGEAGELSNYERHKRVCYVVPEDDADLDAIRESIIHMPAYFEGYDTTVHFITAEELDAKHSGIPHGGIVMRSGRLGDENNRATYSFSLALDSNPEFTASVDIAYARAVYRLASDENYGAKTVLDIPLGYLSSRSSEELRKSLV